MYLTWCCYVAGDGADAEQPVPAAAGQPQQDRDRADELEHHGAAQQETATQVQPYNFKIQLFTKRQAHDTIE